MMAIIEYTTLPGSKKDASRIGLGTWAIGGADWGGTADEEAIETIMKAIDMGITVIDTAPVYGYGRSEELVGRAIQQSDVDRDELIIATKVGLEWDVNGNIWRNSSVERIEEEFEDSLNRLQTDYLDIYQVHWPDPKVAIGKTAKRMNRLWENENINAIGVSNYSPKQMDEFRNFAPIHTCQPPYNLFERGIEEDVLPYCKENDIKLLTYGALCRGLLSGKIDESREFKGDDLRKIDPKFDEAHIEEYLRVVEQLDVFGKDIAKSSIHLAVRWILDNQVDIALWGARKPEQLEDIPNVFNFKLNKIELGRIKQIVEREITKPIPRPEFMAPPTSKSK